MERCDIFFNQILTDILKVNSEYLQCMVAYPNGRSQGFTFWQRGVYEQFQRNYKETEEKEELQGLISAAEQKSRERVFLVKLYLDILEETDVERGLERKSPESTVCEKSGRQI